MKLSEIARALGCEVRGDGGVEITDVAAIEDAPPGTLTFVADRRQAKSPYTEDRLIPGSFEGETVTRRRFMVGSVHLAGAAAAGPRAARDPGRYALLVEAIREGYLLHYGEGRVLVPDDADLALLAGDQLYAIGLAELADLGDLQAVAELADVISLAAAAQAVADEDLAEAVWDAGAVAVGWGGSPAHDAAKGAARTGEPGAAQSLRAAAREAHENASHPR